MEIEKMTMSDEQLVAKETNDIPLELLRDEIFARLPIKTLLQIRCVCKLWCSIIDSQDFKLNSKFRKSPHLLYIDSVEDPNYQYTVRVTLRSMDTFEVINHLCTINANCSFFGTCNGLMLVLIYHRDESILRIWNPSIQKSLLLPPCPFKIYPYFLYETFLLGYPSSNDGDNNFKVAAFQWPHPNPLGGAGEVLMTIYSSRDQRWSSIITRNDVLVPPSLNERVFYQGAWYWLTETHLVSFDFDSEDFISVELPVDVKQGVVTRFIFLCCKKLAVLSVSFKSFCVWVMDKDSEKKSPWRLWFSRDSTHEVLDATCGRLSDIYSRIFYNERDSDTFIFQTYEKVFSYTFSTQQVRVLRTPYNSLVTLDDYVESLALHKEPDGHILRFDPSEHMDLHENKVIIRKLQWSGRSFFG